VPGFVETKLGLLFSPDIELAFDGVNPPKQTIGRSWLTRASKQIIPTLFKNQYFGCSHSEGYIDLSGN